jgi:predicted transcriptional regulator
VLDTLKANTEALQKSEKELQKMVLDGLADKGLRRITNENVNDYVDITKTGDGFQITIKYDQEEPITGKLFFLNKFEKTVEAP